MSMSVSTLNLLTSKILALCLPPNIWVSSHAPMRHQAPNIWVSQHLFGHPGLGQDLRACVGKVLRTFAHIASLCYASYLGKILVRIYPPLNAEAVSAVKVYILVLAQRRLEFGL